MKRALCLILLCLPVLVGAANPLRNHPSPYLAMHGNDPVDWREWGAAAIAEARESGRLLYVSIGYFSCHWCHVMHRESYADPEIAAYLNAHFIPIKVDRELRPALDERLIDFVDKTQGNAGWPLNVFLTPEGHPLYGMTYQPPDGFKTVLESLQAQWGRDAEKLTAAAQAASTQLAALRTGSPEVPRYATPAAVRELGAAFIAQALAAADTLAGGFGDQSKFPSAPQLLALTELHALKPRDDVRDLVEYTLYQMAAQGLRDQLAGGFFRYTVDPAWQIPHFEKMLYDNAQLAQLYLRAGQVFQQSALRQIGLDTLDFVLRDMAADHGGYIAGLSAVDAQGVEGGNYLWDKEQLQTLLDPDEYRLAKILWRLDEPPQTDGGYLPIQAREPREVAAELDLEPPALAARFERIRTKLLKQRATRPAPRDDKVLAGWNGLLLSALSLAAAHPDGQRFQLPAQALRDYLTTVLWDGERLARARDANGAPIGKAGLEDYAYVARGLADYARHTGQKTDADLARRIIRQGRQGFHGERGWRLTQRPLLPIDVQAPSLADGPMFSPSAALIEAALNLDEQTDWFRARLSAAHPDIEDAPFFRASQIGLMNRWLGEY